MNHTNTPIYIDGDGIVYQLGRVTGGGFYRRHTTNPKMEDTDLGFFVGLDGGVYREGTYGHGLRSDYEEDRKWSRLRVHPVGHVHHDVVRVTPPPIDVIEFRWETE